MRIVAKRAGQMPVVEEIADDLKSFNRFVGGYIEMVPMVEEGIYMVCNEEGKLIGLDVNFYTEFDTIVGDVLFCGRDRENEVSLTDEQIQKVMEYFNEK